VAPDRKVPSRRRITVAAFSAAMLVAAIWLGAGINTVHAAKLIAPPAGSLSLADLPIVEVPARTAEGEAFAVMISGDGGWARFDKGLSAELSARGVPLVGLDSLKYFWHARSPEQTAADVSGLIEHYASHWHKARVLLIGYSFGADVMPSIFNRLPAESRARVASVNLLGLGAGASYRITAGEWWPFGKANGLPVLPEIERLRSTPTLCIEGAREKKTICPSLVKLGVEVRQIGEGHHFSFMHKEIADAILAAR
jgi:type IV secretory pathway VirJ component